MPQVLLGSRKISGELSRVTMGGESWSLKRKPAARRHCSAPQQEEAAQPPPPPISPNCGRKGERHSESALGSRNAVKKQMFRKVSRSISMMSHSVAAAAPASLDESEEAEDSVAALRMPRSKSTMTNALQIPSVFERSVSVCEESVNSARKMLEDLFGRRAPPPTPQCSVDLKKASAISVSQQDQQQDPRQRSLSLGGAEARSSNYGERRKMAKFARDTSEVEWIRASSLQTEFESGFCFESVHDLLAAARSVGRTDLVALDGAMRRRRRLRSARLNTFSRSVDVFLLA